MNPSVKEKLNYKVLYLLSKLLFPKNFESWSSKKSGRSSGIQCPDNGTITPCTFVAKARDCIEFNVMLPGMSPPKAGYISPDRTSTGIVSLAVAAYSMLSFASCGKAL